MNTLNKRRFRLTCLLLVVVITISACEVFEPDPTVTPIYVTATPAFIIVTNTYTPAPTPVLAPTLPDAVAENATAGPPTLTPTRLITLTPTFTPTPTDTPATPGVLPFAPAGGISAPAAVGACPQQAQGGFANVYNGNASLSGQLSCPIDVAVNVQTAFQTFERGFMIWVSSVGASGQSGIYVLYANNTHQRFADTWRDGVDPPSLNLPPPSGLLEPIRGFGKVWRESGGVRDGLGWATANENGGSGYIQRFERGEMLYVTQTGQTYILITGAPGIWMATSIPF